MRSAGTGRKFGNVDLRSGESRDLLNYSGHLGYSVLPEHRGNLAREHGLETLWITCNPDNVASGRTCDNLGAELKVDLPGNTNAYRKGERQKLRYKI